MSSQSIRDTGIRLLIYTTISRIKNYYGGIFNNKDKLKSQATFQQSLSFLLKPFKKFNAHQ